nr:MAG TPA: hypothetical protein [Caudoviricetes sp.]
MACLLLACEETLKCLLIFQLESDRIKTPVGIGLTGVLIVTI